MHTRIMISQLRPNIALCKIIARKVESIWAVLNQMHPGISNKLSITFFFLRISDWLTDHLVNSFLCIQNGGSEGERLLCVAEWRIFC